MTQWTLLIAFMATAWSTSAGACQGTAVLTSPQGKSVTYQVEVAQDEAAREKGLMYRTTMPQDEGMVFIWPQVDVRYMWMRNTYIPLDMVYAKEGTVVGVLENVQPLDETPRTAGPANIVLELNAKQAQKHGIDAGWEMAINHSCD